MCIIRTVSYTHLDVYKRQIKIHAINDIKAAKFEYGTIDVYDMNPVYYTHLAILIIIEIVIRILYPSMFMGLPLITLIFSYIILAVLPIEMIAFNSCLVKKHNGMAIEYF